ncbi:MAG: UvrD-helicase domain-containing protein, partial [Treponema sp.]|nr:UvrD-helicase domain-containing protein [Treponema sp.]
LTFKDTSELALLALKEQESIRKQERDSYDFIMIDEFQDNNGPNRDLLLLLSNDDDGKLMQNRLFFVGDEKQSIYKFRGADVSVFNSLEQYITPCQKLPMRRNYRSSNILIDEFNQIFGGFIPSDNAEASINDGGAKIFGSVSAYDYEAKFDQNARAMFPETKTPEKATGARIQFCLYPSQKTDEDIYLNEKNAKALYIAKKILALHQNEGVAFRDIALLVKSRTNYANIARIFSLNKIPFSLDQQGNIFTAATANDFYNVLRLCVYPSDINAFASFLNSPFAGLGLGACEKILSLFPQKAFDPKLDAQALLSKDELSRYQAAQTFYKEMTDYALSNPIADSIDRLWQKEGYKFSLNANEEHYDLLYELARKADLDARDLSWFVDQLAIEKKYSFNEDSEINIAETDYPVENSDSVNEMTIHKSKGLQFKYVFVWGLAETRAGQRPDNSKIFQSQEYGAVVANSGKKQNLFALLAGAEEKRKEDAEARRLIYVAFTRAIKGLFIVGNIPPTA